MKNRKAFYDKRNNYITQRIRTPKKSWKYLKTAKKQWQAERVKSDDEISEVGERFFWGKWEVCSTLSMFLNMEIEGAKYRKFFASPEADMLWSFGFNLCSFYGEGQIGLSIEVQGAENSYFAKFQMECQINLVSQKFKLYRMQCEGEYKFIYDGKIKNLRKHLKNVNSLIMRTVYGKVVLWFKPEKCEWHNLPSEFSDSFDYNKLRWEKRNKKDRWYQMRISEKQNYKVSRNRLFWDDDYPKEIDDVPTPKGNYPIKTTFEFTEH